jgi:uncharacterized protein YbaR (Trm112 family)
MPAACVTGICFFIVSALLICFAACGLSFWYYTCSAASSAGQFYRCRTFFLCTILLTWINAMISQQLLDIIACPKCKGPVQLTKNKDSLVCAACRLLYAIQDDVPIMLIDKAEPLPPATEQA